MYVNGGMVYNNAGIVFANGGELRDNRAAAVDEEAEAPAEEAGEVVEETEAPVEEAEETVEETVEEAAEEAEAVTETEEEPAGEMAAAEEETAAPAEEAVEEPSEEPVEEASEEAAEEPAEAPAGEEDPLALYVAAAPEFEPLKAGYRRDALTAVSAAVTNESDEPVVIRAARLSGRSSGCFVLKAEKNVTIAPGETNDTAWPITPKTNLRPDEYTAKLVLILESGETIEVPFTFTVETAG